MYNTTLTRLGSLVWGILIETKPVSFPSRTESESSWNEFQLSLRLSIAYLCSFFMTKQETWASDANELRFFYPIPSFVALSPT